VRQSEQSNARTLQEILVALDAHLKSQATFLQKMVSFQQDAAPVVERLSSLLNGPAVGALEQHARSIDLSIKDLPRQMAVSADIQTEELRGELRVIARLLAGPGVPGRSAARETEVIAPNSEGL